MSDSYSIIILAAGASNRFGKPKQLLSYKNKTMLQYLIDEAKNTTAASVIVVLGANTEKIQTKLPIEKIHIVINENWKEGMSSSIHCGINELQKIDPDVDAAIIMVCDQPFVTTELLNQLTHTHKETKKQIVTCGYDNTTGPPVLFHKSLFSELLQLKGDVGARKIVEQNPDEVAIVSFPKGNIDIDTVADYENLLG